MFGFLRCFISLKNIPQQQMVFVRANWPTLEAFFKAVWMENLKAVVCAESKYCI